VRLVFETSVPPVVAVVLLCDFILAVS
jgi:hypothetical protein